MTKRKAGMKSWGDLNAALNGLIREGAIAGFRTNRDTNDEPVIWISLPGAADASGALEVVRGKLTGIFAQAEVLPDEADGRPET